MNDCPVRPVATPKQISRCLIPRECLGDLARDPFCGRICGDVGPHEAAPIQPHDHDGIEELETDGWHYENVDGADVRCVVVQEGTPSLAWRTAPLDHVLGNGRLDALKPEFDHFPCNPLRSPTLVLLVHPPV